MSNYHRDWERLGRSIRQIVKQTADSREFQELKQTVSQTARRFSENTTADTQKPDTDSLYAKTTGLVVGGSFKALFGGSLACFCFLLTVIFAIYNTAVAGTGLLDASFILSLTAMFVGGIVTWGGIDDILMARRFRKYRRALGDKTQLALSKLARAIGKPEEFVRKDLQKMLKRGLFIEGRLNNEQTWLLTSREAWRLFEDSRLQLEQRRKEQEKAPPQPQPSPVDPKLREVLDKGSAFIAQLRKCNDDIPGDEISAKIDRMERVVERIFQRAKDHPEVVPDLKKLMDYYLPMTVKLLRTYADMDAQPVQGETIQSSKREIEGTLDTINTAFENLLDDLYEDTALDVSSDISVLQTLLAQEGLTGSDFTETQNP